MAKYTLNTGASFTAGDYHIQLNLQKQEILPKIMIQFPKVNREFKFYIAYSSDGFTSDINYIGASATNHSYLDENLYTFTTAASANSCYISATATDVGINIAELYYLNLNSSALRKRWKASSIRIYPETSMTTTTFEVSEIKPNTQTLSHDFYGETLHLSDNITIATIEDTTNVVRIDTNGIYCLGSDSAATRDYTKLTSTGLSSYATKSTGSAVSSIIIGELAASGVNPAIYGAWFPRIFVGFHSDHPTDYTYAPLKISDTGNLSISATAYAGSDAYTGAAGIISIYNTSYNQGGVTSSFYAEANDWCSILTGKLTNTDDAPTTQSLDALRFYYHSDTAALTGFKAFSMYSHSKAGVKAYDLHFSLYGITTGIEDGYSALSRFYIGLDLQAMADLYVVSDAFFANGTTYKIDSAGDAVLKKLVILGPSVNVGLDGYVLGRMTYGTAGDLGVMWFGAEDTNPLFRAGFGVYQIWDGAATDYGLKFQVHNGGVGDVLSGLVNGVGNWTLGASDLASTTSKLYVDGVVSVSGNMNCLSNCYFANGTTYKVDASGNATFLGGSFADDVTLAVGKSIIPNANTSFIGFGDPNAALSGNISVYGANFATASYRGTIIIQPNTSDADSGCGQLIFAGYNSGQTIWGRFNKSGNLTLGETDSAGSTYRIFIKSPTGKDANLVLATTDAESYAYQEFRSGTNLIWSMGKMAGSANHDWYWYSNNYSGGARTIARINSTYGNWTLGSSSDLAGATYKLFIKSPTGKDANLVLATTDAESYAYQEFRSGTNLIWQFGKLPAAANHDFYIYDGNLSGGAATIARINSNYGGWTLGSASDLASNSFTLYVNGNIGIADTKFIANTSSTGYVGFGGCLPGAVYGSLIECFGKDYPGGEGWLDLYSITSNAAATAGRIRFISYDGANWNCHAFMNKSGNWNFGTGATDSAGSTYKLYVNGAMTGASTASFSSYITAQGSGSSTGCAGGYFWNYADANNTATMALQVGKYTTGDMADGFGPQINFRIKDTGADNGICAISAVRNGADNSGFLAFQTTDAGTWYSAYLTNKGQFHLGGTTDANSILHVDADVLNLTYGIHIKGADGDGKYGILVENITSGRGYSATVTSGYGAYGSATTGVGVGGFATGTNGYAGYFVASGDATIALSTGGLIKLSGWSTGAAAALTVYVDSNGYLTSNSSSKRYKKDIIPLKYSKESILAIEPVTFNWIKEGFEDSGAIAEQVYEHIPEIVHIEKGQIESVKYEKLPILLLKVLREHEETINQLKSEIELLKARV